MEEKKKSNKIYVYNIGQANFYLQNGAVPIQLGVGDKNNEPFAVFRYQDHQKLFSYWLDAQSTFQMINQNDL